MPYAVCPGCNEEIYLPKRPQLGDIVTCEGCENELQVVSTNPLELDWYDEDEEDLGDDIDDDEDEDEDD